LAIEIYASEASKKFFVLIICMDGSRPVELAK